MKNFTPETIEKAKAAKSAEELLALAKENNIEMTEEEAKAYFDQLNSASCELSEEKLTDVSGGAVYLNWRYAGTVADKVQGNSETTESGK